MPERKEKAQLLRDEDTAQLSVKPPGETEVPLHSLSVRCTSGAWLYTDLQALCK